MRGDINRDFESKIRSQSTYPATTNLGDEEYADRIEQNGRADAGNSRAVAD